MISKIKNTVPWTLNGEEVIETFYEKELQETNQTILTFWWHIGRC